MSSLIGTACPGNEQRNVLHLRGVWGGWQLCFLLPIIDDGMKTSHSQCHSLVSYCFAETLNCSGFKKDNSAPILTQLK